LQAEQGRILHRRRAPATPQASLRDLKARFASIENYIATLHGDQARTGVTIDELAACHKRHVTW
jgi:hypothetical protein